MNAPLVRVLVVDDSAVVRSLVRGAPSRHPQIEVVGLAVDGVDALKKIAALRPDVVTLDIEMPRLNGIGVLDRAAGKVPVSFVMVSTLTQTGARVTFEALNKGAFDYVTKPQTAGKVARPEFQKNLQQKVLAAARAKGRTRRTLARTPTGSVPTLPPNQARGWVVAVGISCGGPQTLHEMLPAFPSDFVPIIVTQHMPAQFTGPFAQHLDAACAMEVREAGHHERLQPGSILIAPGSHHLRVVRHGALLMTQLDDGPLVSGHRPSADVMFKSVAKANGPRTIGVIMTGMGRDGAEGIVDLAEAGAQTIAQDEETSLVYGMPKAAVAAGGVRRVVPLPQIPATIARVMQADPGPHPGTGLAAYPDRAVRPRRSGQTIKLSATASRASPPGRHRRNAQPHRRRLGNVHTPGWYWPRKTATALFASRAGPPITGCVCAAFNRREDCETGDRNRTM